MIETFRSGGTLTRSGDGDKQQKYQGLVRARAHAINSQNKVQAALEAVQKALALNQNSVEAHFLSGAVERRADNFAASEKQRKKCSRDGR